MLEAQIARVTYQGGGLFEIPALGWGLIQAGGAYLRGGQFADLPHHHVVHCGLWIREASLHLTFHSFFFYSSLQENVYKKVRLKRPNLTKTGRPKFKSLISVPAKIDITSFLYSKYSG